MHLESGKSPWYREPFVWLLISIPATAVLGGVVTLALAIATNDGLVVDDYYWHGKQINRVLSRDRAAARQGISVDVLLNYEDRVVTVYLSARVVTLPSTLRLSLLHATRSGQDRALELSRSADGSYFGPLPALVPGHWYVQFEGHDWRVVGSLRVPDDVRMHITAAAAP
jgi:uncharacterized protein